MHRLKTIANPLHRDGFFALPHLLIIAIAVLIAYALGVFTGPSITNYYAAHFRAPQPVPIVHQRVFVRPKTLPATGSIDIARYPAVGDQDGMGSCAAWASAWALSYEYRMRHPSSYLRFSPRQMYSHFSDQYSGGQDQGSWPDQDAEISNTVGLLQFKMLPYPSYVIDKPELPTYDSWGHLSLTDAAKHRIPFTFHYLSGFATGGGQGLVDAIRQTVADGHPVMIAFPVYPEYDNATQQPDIVAPKAGEVSRGGHENVVLAYDDTRPMPDGTTGSVLVQNQWRASWGSGGRAWMSYSFIRQYVFDAEYAVMATAAPKAGTPPKYRPNPAPLHNRAPVPPGALRRVTAGSWYVHSVPGYRRLSDGRVVYWQDLAPLINYWGDRYHISPVGITGTLFTESSGIINAERWAGGLDNSCGLLQQIIVNVQAYYGIYGSRAECDWEENPANSIMFGARLLKECSDYHGGRIPFAYLDVGYNAGCGWPDWYFYTPSASDVQAHLYAYINNYNYALAHYSGGGPTPPPPPPHPKPTFSLKRWCAYATAHHTACVSHRWHGKLSWAASVWVGAQHFCGGVVHKDVWYGPGRGNVGFSGTRFATCKILTWPRYHTAKIVRARRIQ